MTKTEAEAAITKYGSQRKAADGLGCSRKVFERALAKAEAVTTSPVGQTEVRGFVLRTDSRVLGKRPQQTLRAKFYGLKRGQAFRVKDIGQAWGVSAETVQRHAADLECYRYVETGPEQWEPCVMHPDTAKQYPK